MSKYVYVYNNIDDIDDDILVYKGLVG